MDTANPFAQTPATPESIIDQVRCQLVDDGRYVSRVPTGELEHVAERAVRELWGSPVRTFVRSWPCARRGRCWRAQGAPPAAAQPVRCHTEPRDAEVERDTLTIGDYVLCVDDHDVLRHAGPS